MDAPYAFKHELDPDLFALDRLEAVKPAFSSPTRAASELREPSRR